MRLSKLQIMRGYRLVQGRCTVGSIRDANRSPCVPLAALIPLLHRAPLCACVSPSICLIVQGLFQLEENTGTAAWEFCLILSVPVRVGLSVFLSGCCPRPH